MRFGDLERIHLIFIVVLWNLHNFKTPFAVFIICSSINDTHRYTLRVRFVKLLSLKSLSVESGAREKVNLKLFLNCGVYTSVKLVCMVSIYFIFSIFYKYLPIRYWSNCTIEMKDYRIRRCLFLLWIWENLDLWFFYKKFYVKNYV